MHAFFDMREQGVLLRFVEPMDFIEEQDGALAALTETIACPIAHLANILHTRVDC